MTRAGVLAVVVGCASLDAPAPTPSPAPALDPVPAAPAPAPASAPAVDPTPAGTAIAVSRADPAIGDRAPCRRPTFGERAQIAVPGELHTVHVSDGGAAIAATVSAPGARTADRAIVWDATTGALRATFTAASAAPVVGVVVSADAGAMYVATAEHGTDLATVRTLELPTLGERWRRERLAGELALADDGETLFVTAGDHVTGLRAADGTLVGRTGANHMADAAAVPSTGDVITVSAAGGVERMRFGARDAIAEIRAPAHDANPHAIVVTRDGAAIAALNYETLELFDVTTGAHRWDYVPDFAEPLAVGVAIGGPYVIAFYERGGPSAALVASVFRRDGKRLAEPVLATLDGKGLAAVDRSGTVIAAGGAAGPLVVRAIGCP